MLGRAFAVSCLLASSSAAFASPSFNCKKASTKVEKVICKSVDLGNLDKEIAEKYKAIVKSLSGSKLAAFKQGQVAWLKTRDVCGSRPETYSQGGDVDDCLFNVMSSRVGQLVEMQPNSNGSGSTKTTFLGGPFSDPEKADQACSRLGNWQLADAAFLNVRKNRPTSTGAVWTRYGLKEATFDLGTGRVDLDGGGGKIGAVCVRGASKEEVVAEQKRNEREVNGRGKSTTVKLKDGIVVSYFSGPFSSYEAAKRACNGFGDIIDHVSIQDDDHRPVKKGFVWVDDSARTGSTFKGAKANLANGNLEEPKKGQKLGTVCQGKVMPVKACHESCIVYAADPERLCYLKDSYNACMQTAMDESLEKGVQFAAQECKRRASVISDAAASVGKQSSHRYAQRQACD